MFGSHTLNVESDGPMKRTNDDGGERQNGDVLCSCGALIESPIHRHHHWVSIPTDTLKTIQAH